MNNTESERKFTVCNNNFLYDNDGCETIIQGYISTDPARSVRVRRNIKNGVIHNTLTIKGERSGCTRSEIEIPISHEQSNVLLDMCLPSHIIEKIRIQKNITTPIQSLFHTSQSWEVDVFLGENQGLVLAEIELKHPNDSLHNLPDFISTEVTDDSRYYNANLIHNPFSKWNI